MLILAFLPDDSSARCERLNFRFYIGCNDRDSGTGFEQGIDFCFRDFAGANYKTRATFEFYENGEEGSRHGYSPAPCGTGPGERSRPTAIISSPASCARRSASEWRAK